MTCTKIGCQKMNRRQFADEPNPKGYSRITCTKIGYQKICRQQFEAINGKLDRLDEAIRGNGKPGIQLRLDRLESAQSARKKFLWLVIGALVAAAAATAWKFIVQG